MSEAPVLAAGDRVRLGEGPDLGLVVAVGWERGPEDPSLVAFICTPQGSLVSQEHFVFFRNRVASDRSVFLLEGETLQFERVAQLMIDGSAVSTDVVCIHLALVTLPLSGHTLRSASSVEVAIWDPTNGRDLASFSVTVPRECSCLRLARLHAAHGVWELEGVGETYDKDFASLAREYGVPVRD
jgi:stress response protein SCP2